MPLRKRSFQVYAKIWSENCAATCGLCSGGGAIAVAKFWRGRQCIITEYLRKYVSAVSTGTSGSSACHHTTPMTRTASTTKELVGTAHHRKGFSDYCRSPNRRLSKVGPKAAQKIKIYKTLNSFCDYRRAKDVDISRTATFAAT